MSAHTPGPWHAVQHYMGNVSVVDAHGFEHVSATDVAVLLGYQEKLRIRHWADSPAASRDIGTEVQAANARLIAAAPELLEALEGLMALECRGRVMPIGREWDAARAAIKKATAEPR